MSKKKRTLKRKLKAVIKKAKVVSRNSYYLKYYYGSQIDEKRVLIESKHGEDIAGNMFYILKQFSTEEYKDYTVYLSAKAEKFEVFKSLFQRYKISNVILVEKSSKLYVKLLATAKYLFNDTTFPPFFIKKSEQVYTNTWHGTPLKCMGNDVANRRYALGNVMRNFMMASYLVYPNQEMEEKMTRAYAVDKLYQGNILEAGYPRNAIFYNQDRAKELKQELGYDGKQVIVYMPTWRGVMTNRLKNEQAKSIVEKLHSVDAKLQDNQILLVKMHILVQTNLDLSTFKHVCAFPEGYETYDVLNAADCLITDYSSVFFDYANSGKKIILYTYDEEEYTATRGFYYKLEDLPFPKVDTPEKLVDEINKEKDYDDTEFIKRFCSYDNIKADKSLVDFVVKGIESDMVTKKCVTSAGKDNVLIYSGALALNGITSALTSLLRIIDTEKENIIISFRENSVKRAPERVDKLSSDVNVYPIISGFNYSYLEMLAYVIYYKFNLRSKWAVKKLDRFYQRELLRFYGNSKFERVIQFMGYEKRVIGLYQRFEVPKAIFVHNDMGKEISSKANQHRLTLEDAYTKYDRVVCVTEDVKASCLEISKRKDNVVVVNNAHDYKTIHEKMNLPIKYDAVTESNVSENVLKQLLAKEDYVKFINIGRFSPEKGHQRLINAFDRFYIDNPKSYLFIIGGYGVDWNATNQYIKTKQCRYNVILIKNISNPFSILKECDLFVFSSFYEALGLVVLEAQTCGVPVISTDISGPRGFMLEHGGTLVENSEEGIYKGMNDFMEGKVSMMNIDPEVYNQAIKVQYENIFK